MAQVIEKVKGTGIFQKIAVVSPEGDVIASEGFTPTAEEAKAISKILDDFDTAIGHGITIEGNLYDLHRVHPEPKYNLAYGRRGGYEDGDGVVIHRTEKHYVLGTFFFPVTSARAVPIFKKAVAEASN